MNFHPFDMKNEIVKMHRKNHLDSSVKKKLSPPLGGLDEMK